MSNNQRSYNKKGTGDDVAVELRKCREERRRLEKEERKKKMYCDHKDHRGRGILTPQGDGKLECNKCGTVIYAQVQSLAEINMTCDAAKNIVECLKISAEPEYVPGLAKILEGIDSIPELYEKIVLKGKNKRKGDGNGGDNINQKSASYKSSKL